VPSTGIGAIDPSNNWNLRNEASAGTADAGMFAFGSSSMIPVTGDWTGSGHTGIGEFDPSTQTWYLRNEDSAGAPDAGTFQFGAPGSNWIPVTGDWTGTGHTGIGLFDPTTETWYLRSEDSAGTPDAGMFQFGAPGWTPVTGDWAGSGHTGIGAVDPTTETWYLRNEDSAGTPDAGSFVYGFPGWTPVTGDWAGSGHTGIGAIDPSTETWHLRNEVSAGASDAGSFVYGLVNWKPVTGQWTAPATSISVSPPSTNISTVTAGVSAGFNVNGTFTDSGGVAEQPFTAVVNWGDGRSDPAIVSTASAFTYSFHGAHTYATNGTFHVTVSVTDHTLVTGTSLATDITVNAPLAITTPTLNAGTVSVPYSQAVQTLGGTGPLMFHVSVGSLPAGLALDPGTGNITGTPTAATASTFTVAAADALGSSAAQQYTLTINDTAPPAPAPPAPTPTPAITNAVIVQNVLSLTLNGTPVSFQLPPGTRAVIADFTGDGTNDILLLNPVAGSEMLVNGQTGRLAAVAFTHGSTQIVFMFGDDGSISGVYVNGKKIA
jgi:hypothetical protein